MTTTLWITFIGVYGKPAGKLAANTQQTHSKLAAKALLQMRPIKKAARRQPFE
jgi:hypothetical protein